MDRELKVANRIYIAVTVFLTTAMVAGAALLQHAPHSFYA